MNNQQKEKEFEKDFYKSIKECKKIGYNPTRLTNMLSENKNNLIKLAENLVITGDIKKGLTTLAKKKRLDLSIESLIIKYNDLFDDETVNAARWKINKAKLT